MAGWLQCVMAETSHTGSAEYEGIAQVMGMTNSESYPGGATTVKYVPFAPKLGLNQVFPQW